MDLIPFGQSGRFPFFHGLKASHDVKHIPESATALATQPEKSLLCLKTITVDRINPSANPFVGVIVAHKKKSAIGIDRPDF